MTRLTYVGHATVLIEMDGVRILTDPILRPRAGLLRRRGLPINPDWLRGIDGVLISHLHWDHLDLPSLRLLGRSTRLLVPHGSRAAFRRWSFPHAQEVQRGDERAIGALRITATYAEHDGFRPPFGPRADALGFLVEGTQRIYFAGDTDLFPAMRALGNGLDAALLPVGGWGPNVGAGHLDPRRAAEALSLLRPRLAMPIHWGTLHPLGMGRLLEEVQMRAPVEFARFAAELAPAIEVRVVPAGGTITLLDSKHSKDADE